MLQYRFFTRRREDEQIIAHSTALLLRGFVRTIQGVDSKQRRFKLRHCRKFSAASDRASDCRGPDELDDYDELARHSVQADSCAATLPVES